MEEVTSKNTDWVKNGFQALETQLNGAKGSSYHLRRQEALASFQKIGFPTPKDEEWKYTNLATLTKIAFALPPAQEPELSASSLQPFWVPDLDCHKLVFVNGKFSSTLSSFAQESGVSINTISSFLDESKQTDALTESFAAHFSKHASHEDNAFVALNTSLVQDGVFVKVEKGVKADKPIFVLFVTSEQSDSIISNPRVLIDAGREAEVTVIEKYVDFGGVPNFSNPVTEIAVGENASVDHYRLHVESRQSFHVSNISVDQLSNSRFSTSSFCFGGGLVRNNLEIRLNGENCDSILNGLSALVDGQHVDNHTLVDHIKPHCESRELYKGIYNDESKGVFSGSIIVRPDAQKTNAIQSNQSILLSDKASVDTKPQLKIWADDVKCTHGATIGQLDENALFYIRSRGVPKEEARNILVHAFASDVINQVKHEALKEHLEEELIKKL